MRATPRKDVITTPSTVTTATPRPSPHQCADCRGRGLQYYSRYLALPEAEASRILDLIREARINDVREDLPPVPYPAAPTVKQSPWSVVGLDWRNYFAPINLLGLPDYSQL